MCWYHNTINKVGPIGSARLWVMGSRAFGGEPSDRGFFQLYNRFGELGLLVELLDAPFSWCRAVAASADFTQRQPRDQHPSTNT